MKKVWFWLCLLTFGTVVFLGFAIFYKIDKDVASNMYVLSFQQENEKFTENDISNMEREGAVLSYFQELYPDVSNGLAGLNIKVIATNENYAYFSRMKILSGAFFNTKQMERKMCLAVVNKAAANVLFGSKDCIGEKIYLDGIAYEIIGISETTDDSTQIFIPYSTIDCLKDKSNNAFRQVWCSFGSVAEAALLLANAGIEFKKVEIQQMDLCKRVFFLRALFPVFFVMIVVFVQCCRKIISICKDEKTGILCQHWLGVLLPQGCMAGISIIALIVILKIGWCVPPYYQVAGMKGMELFFCILDFYSLTNVAVIHMEFIRNYNLISFLYVSVALCGLFFIFGRYKKCQ